MTGVVIILTTAPADERAEALANALVTERLAACVNISAPMTSLYRWTGRVERDTECQLVIKTTRDRVDALRQRIAELHSYELPEFLVIAVAEGSDAYLEWVVSGTRDEP